MSDSLKAISLKSVQVIVGLVFTAATLAILFFVVYRLFEFISQVDKAVAAAILAASATVIASTLTVVVGKYYERKREIESHFRSKKVELYDEFLQMIFALLAGKRSSDNEVFVDELREWQRRLMLWSGPGTIRAYIKWTQRLKNGVVDAESVFLMDDLIRSIRKDLGLSSRGLERGTSAHLILREADLFLALARADPSITLEEVSKVEKEKTRSSPER